MKYLALVLLLTLVVFFSGCANNPTPTPQPSPTPTQPPTIPNTADAFGSQISEINNLDTNLTTPELDQLDSSAQAVENI